MKKIKKLTLNKIIVSSLSNPLNAQKANQIKGGGTDAACGLTTIEVSFTCTLGCPPPPTGGCTNGCYPNTNEPGCVMTNYPPCASAICGTAGCGDTTGYGW